MVSRKQRETTAGRPRIPLTHHTPCPPSRLPSALPAPSQGLWWAQATFQCPAAGPLPLGLRLPPRPRRGSQRSRVGPATTNPECPPAAMAHMPTFAGLQLFTWLFTQLHFTHPTPCQGGRRCSSACRPIPGCRQPCSNTLSSQGLLNLTAATVHALCKCRSICPSERNSTIYTPFLPCKALSTWATPHPCRQRCRRPRCRQLVAAGLASAALTMPGAAPGRPPPVQSAGAAPRCGWRRPPRPPHGPCSPAAHAPAAPPQPCLWAEQTRGWRGRLGGVTTWRGRTAGPQRGRMLGSQQAAVQPDPLYKQRATGSAHTHPSASLPRQFITTAAHCPQQPHPTISPPTLPHLAPWAAAPPQCDPPGCQRRGCPAPR